MPDRTKAMAEAAAKDAATRLALGGSVVDPRPSKPGKGIARPILLMAVAIAAAALASALDALPAEGQEIVRSFLTALCASDGGWCR